MGGHEAVRHMWEDYVCECSAVLFLLDAADSVRLEEAGWFFRVPLCCVCVLSLP
jgi:GTP-binding protein SAR1